MENYIELFNQLPTKYQFIVMNTFLLLVSYDDNYMEKGLKIFDIAGFIIMKRNEMGLTNKEICEQATNLFRIDNPNSDKTLKNATLIKCFVEIHSPQKRQPTG